MIKRVPHIASEGWNVHYEVHIKELAFLVCMPIWLSYSTGNTIHFFVPPTSPFAFTINDDHGQLSRRFMPQCYPG
jgi:hypothetical protein